MILAIDTSVGVSVALHDGARTVAERHTGTHGVQGELCAAMIAEVLTTAGVEPADVTQVVGTADEVEGLNVPDPTRVAYITQTTLSLDETNLHVLPSETA